MWYYLKPVGFLYGTLESQAILDTLHDHITAYVISFGAFGHGK